MYGSLMMYSGFMVGLWHMIGVRWIMEISGLILFFNVYWASGHVGGGHIEVGHLGMGHMGEGTHE